MTGRRMSDSTEAKFPWTGPVRATYRVVTRGGEAWVTQGPELDVEPRRAFVAPIAPEVDPDADLMTPLGIRRCH